MKLQEIKVEESFCARNQLESLSVIFQIVSTQKKQLTDYNNAKTDIEIIALIRLITSEIYSGCEIINEMLISIYRNIDRYRGSQLKNSFNYNFKKVYNAAVYKKGPLNHIYQDDFIFSLFFNGYSE